MHDLNEEQKLVNGELDEDEEDTLDKKEDQDQKEGIYQYCIVSLYQMELRNTKNRKNRMKKIFIMMINLK